MMKGMRGAALVGLMMLGSVAVGQLNEAEKLIAKPATESGFTRLVELGTNGSHDARISALRSLSFYALNTTLDGRVKLDSPKRRELDEIATKTLTDAIKGQDGDAARAAWLSILFVPVTAKLPDPLNPCAWSPGAYLGPSDFVPALLPTLAGASRPLLESQRLDIVLGAAPFLEFYLLADRVRDAQPDIVRHVARRWCRTSKGNELILAQQLLFRCGPQEDDLPFLLSLLENRALWVRGGPYGKLPWHFASFSQRPFALRIVTGSDSPEDRRAAFLDRDPDIVAFASYVYEPSKEELAKAIPVLVRSKMLTQLTDFDAPWLDMIAKETARMSPEFAAVLLSQWCFNERFPGLLKRYLPVLERTDYPPDLSRIGFLWNRDPLLLEPLLRSKSDYVRQGIVKAMVSAVSRVLRDRTKIDAFAKAYVARILGDRSKDVRRELGAILADLPAGIKEKVSKQLASEGWTAN